MRQIKLISSTTIVLLFSISQISCDAKEKKSVGPTTDSVKVCKKDSINPNGTSELASWMRWAVEFSDTLKKNITEGKDPGTFPEKANGILTAKPTGDDMKPDGYDGFANDLIKTLKSVYSAPQVKRKDVYNQYIETCISCHNVSCQGPVKRIIKLRI